MALKLGCIADDFTGATDLASMLVRHGMRTEMLIEAPAEPAPRTEVDAVVVALKSRTAPAPRAVADSLMAARWLRAAGATQIYLKICSTFDSTPEGNIGPVAEALIDLLRPAIVPVAPALPENGRTVYQGHLFVGDRLLNESGMQHHPLTPMTDANLVRVLQAQCRHERVGLVTHDQLTEADSTNAALSALAATGVRLAIIDAVNDDQLHTLALACRGRELVIGGSGLAIGMPALHGLSPNPGTAALPPASGHAAIVSGSCSTATNRQVKAFVQAGGAALAIDPLRAASEDLAGHALEWAAQRLGSAPVLIHATADAQQVRRVQKLLGVEHAGALVEATLARIARGLVDAGVGRLLVAGGETSGACVKALGIQSLRIGAAIEPGVPWCHAAVPGLHIALKSGNFGSDGFFGLAFERLP